MRAFVFYKRTRLDLGCSLLRWVGDSSLVEGVVSWACPMVAFCVPSTSWGAPLSGFLSAGGAVPCQALSQVGVCCFGHFSLVVMVILLTT